ncbi:RNA-binding protein Lupus La [Artemisia annua]|uniref:RNA-binding protein Lupus La n=1 Tax=Artemisia annua TaxID=35608 RepID=A0A2U1PTD8_ARTAN|nr:RNA-binding protein Lupus La [Artemisia annua]
MGKQLTFPTTPSGNQMNFSFGSYFSGSKEEISYRLPLDAEYESIEETHVIAIDNGDFCETGECHSIKSFIKSTMVNMECQSPKGGHNVNDHQQQPSYRRSNSGQHSRGDGSNHYSNGGKWDQDRGNNEWNQHNRSFKGRDTNVNHQRGYARGYVRPTVHAPTFISQTMPLPVRPFGNIMIYPGSQEWNPKHLPIASYQDEDKCKAIFFQVPKRVQQGQLPILRGKGLPRKGFFVDHGDLRFVGGLQASPKATTIRQPSWWRTRATPDANHGNEAVLDELNKLSTDYGVTKELTTKVNAEEYRVTTSVLGDEQWERFNESATVLQTMTLNQLYMAWNGRTTHMRNRPIGTRNRSNILRVYVITNSLWLFDQASELFQMAMDVGFFPINAPLSAKSIEELATQFLMLRIRIPLHGSGQIIEAVIVLSTSEGENPQNPLYAWVVGYDGNTPPDPNSYIIISFAPSPEDETRTTTSSNTLTGLNVAGMTDAPTAKRPKRPVRLKRTWKPQEDEKLMDAMMELHASGKYAADNGFKQATHKRLRICWITSGFGWDPDKCLLTAPNDVWDAYVKTHPKADVLRDKPFIYYHKLATIFGKDRASGSRAVDLGEEEVVSETEETTPTDIEGIDVDSGVNPSLENVGVKGTKRKRCKTDELIHIYSSSCDTFHNTINAIGNEMNKNLSKMANEDERKIQCEIDLMKKVQNEIDALPDITFEEAYEAINVIGKCPFKAINEAINALDEDKLFILDYHDVYLPRFTMMPLPKAFEYLESHATGEKVRQRINLQKAVFELEETNLRNTTELQHLDDGIAKQQD